MSLLASTQICVDDSTAGSCYHILTIMYITKYIELRQADLATSLAAVLDKHAPPHHHTTSMPMPFVLQCPKIPIMFCLFNSPLYGKTEPLASYLIVTQSNGSCGYNPLCPLSKHHALKLLVPKNTCTTFHTVCM